MTMQQRLRVTCVCTMTSTSTKQVFVIPACELYRTLEQATEQVLRREYEVGMPTWLIHVDTPRLSAHKITPVQDVF